MIHVDRSRVPPPAILKSERASMERAKMERFLRDANEKAVLEYPFMPQLYWNPDVRRALWELFQGKCAYCESSLQGGGELDHFRPKRGAVNRDGEKSLGHYWWLVYEWDNLYVACQLCNRLKATRFATLNARVSAGSLGTDLFAEEALLLDPCDPRMEFQPEKHLTFVEQSGGVIAVSNTPQGQYTIECVALNRTALIVERAKHLIALRSLFETFNLKKPWSGKNAKIMDLLKSKLGSDHPYAGMNRQFTRQILHDAAANPWYWHYFFGEESPIESAPAKKRKVAATTKTYKKHTERQSSYSVEREDEQQKETYYSGAKRIERIEFRNFKAIQKLDLVFPPPPTDDSDLAATNREAWMMLLGENATGKSSILQGIALTLMGEKHSNELGLDARRFVRRKAVSGAGSVKVTLTNIPQPIILTFNHSSRRFKVNPKEPKVLLLGYGATRLLPPETEEKGSADTHVRVKNLFRPTAPLNDAEEWLLNRAKLPDEKFEWVQNALKKLLMLPEKVEFERIPKRKPTRVEVTLADGRVGLRDLSDGLQSVLALCTDIMISLLERWDVETAEGIVLLDEIEVHLHPRWKIEVVRLLRDVFPRVAFITTTHDPLCLKGLQPQEIVVLRRNDRNKVVASTDVVSVDELRADQLLTSPLFGMHNTRGHTSQKVVRYSQLLSKRRRTTQEQEEFELLKQTLDSVLTSAETPLQREAETILHRGLVSPENSRSLPDGSMVVIPSPEIREELKYQLSRLLKK